MSRYRQARFLTSAPDVAHAPADTGAEVAFGGRSNAGKSSAINAITHQTGLARTSKTPGRTQLINFFSLDDDHRLVDLPGYGFAKVAVSVRRKWGAALETYLRERQSLRGLIQIMDVRHPLKEQDVQLIEWCQHIGLPLHILLTKADKLKQGPALACLHQVNAALEEAGMHATVQLFSATKKRGLEEVNARLDSWLDVGGRQECNEPQHP